MKLSQLLRDVPVVSIKGNVDCSISRVTRDTREVNESTLFVAICGEHFDGHTFVADMEKGIAVVEREMQVSEAVTLVVVRDSRRALAECAAALMEHPSRTLPVVGITGTNGKTTVSTLVEQAMLVLKRPIGRIGTTGIAMNGVVVPSNFTTPEAPQLHELFREMKAAHCDAVVMEVSSIGLALNRVHGVEFYLGVFTNLSHDHLDFHGSMEEYTSAKARLFKEYLRPKGGGVRALVWGEDPARAKMSLPEDVWSYGFQAEDDLFIERIQLSPAGMELRVRTPMGITTFSIALIGRFNALNAVAALGIGVLLGVPLKEMGKALSRAQGAPGRMERVGVFGGVTVVVDYAHTPDALHGALRSLRELTDGRVGIVFGCGGDRDREKRPSMGRIAEQNADFTCVTSDNPRTESPERIVEDIASGFVTAPTHVEVSRADAIEWALRQGVPGDVILIAGKGHETYQEINGVKHPFDDRAIARNIMGVQ